jgi:methyl-accepting chemotaxis protein
MSIQYRFLLAFAVVLGLMGGLAVYGVSQIRAAGDLAKTLYDKPLIAVSYTRLAHVKFNTARSGVEQSLHSRSVPSPERLDGLERLIGDLLQDLDTVKTRADHQTVAAVEEAEERIRDWSKTGLAVLTIAQTPRMEPSWRTSLEEKANAAAAALDFAAESAAAHGFNYRMAAGNNPQTFEWNMIAWAIVLACLGLLGSLALSYSLTKPIRTATRIAGRVATGNFSDVIASTRRDELGALLRSLAHMQEALREGALAAAQEAERQRSSAERCRRAQKNSALPPSDLRPSSWTRARRAAASGLRPKILKAAAQACTESAVHWWVAPRTFS